MPTSCNKIVNFEKILQMIDCQGKIPLEIFSIRPHPEVWKTKSHTKTIAHGFLKIMIFRAFAVRNYQTGQNHGPDGQIKRENGKNKEFRRLEIMFVLYLIVGQFVQLLSGKMEFKRGGKMKRLLRLIRDAKNYKEFEETVLHFLRWYQIPLNWTKSDLHAFYFNHGGKI